MASMSIARVMFREMGNPFICHLRHVACVVVRVVPESLTSGCASVCFLELIT